MKTYNLPICPLVQRINYNFKRGFIVKSRLFSHAAMNQLALKALREYGSIYVTGEEYSRLIKDQANCLEYNTGIGKTSWVRFKLMPELIKSFERVEFINLEEFLSVLELLRGKIKRAAVVRRFNLLFDKIEKAKSLIVLDEIQVLFPASGITDRQPGIFDASYASYQIKIWGLLHKLKNSGVKIIFISYLHPQDASLTGSWQKAQKNMYQGDPNFLMIFGSPVFEIEGRPPDDQMLNL